MSDDSEKPKQTYLPEHCLPKAYYDGKNYWLKLETEFVSMGPRDLQLALKRRFVFVKGISEQNSLITLGERVMSDAQELRRVAYAGPLAGHRPGVFETEDGRKILVTRGANIPTATPGDWSSLRRFLLDMFEPEQFVYVLCWFKAARMDLLNADWRTWHAAQMLVLGGSQGAGKSLFQAIVTKFLGGRQANPFKYFAERTDFNGDLGQSESWCMEDIVGQKDIKSREAWASKIKEATVNTTINIRSLYAEAISLPILRRTHQSLNLDQARDLMSVPPLVPSILDRLSLISCNPVTWLTKDRRWNWKMTGEQVPQFCWFLDTEFEIPEEMRCDRYQVIAYHNAGMKERIDGLDISIAFLEMIDEGLFPEGDLASGPHTEIKGTHAQIKEMLLKSSVASAVAPLFSHFSACGQYLGQIEARHPDRVRHTKSRNTRTWYISPPPRDSEKSA